jgi:hypothetical protein
MVPVPAPVVPAGNTLEARQALARSVGQEGTQLVSATLRATTAGPGPTPTVEHQLARTAGSENTGRGLGRLLVKDVPVGATR